MVWRWYVRTYVRRRRPWPARGKICACAFLVYACECCPIAVFSQKKYAVVSEASLTIKYIVLVFVHTVHLPFPSVLGGNEDSSEEGSGSPGRHSSSDPGSDLDDLDELLTRDFPTADLPSLISKAMGKGE